MTMQPGNNGTRFALTASYDISRVIKGGWHLAGGHGPIDREQAFADMARFVNSGLTTFDCADIYTGVEQLIGDWLHLSGRRDDIEIHTKFVPDLNDLRNVDEAYVRRIVDRSLERLGEERIHLVQFHWWDFNVPGYIEAALSLEKLRDQGKIIHVGVTNFDAEHLAELLDAGVRVLTNQVQFSVLDRRPAGRMAELCRERGVKLLCYGTVAGGYLSERYLDAPEPTGPDENRSLTKYGLIIEDTGGWQKFQAVLRALKAVADKHRVSIATVASAFVLREEIVAAVIIGARNASHLEENWKSAHLQLDSGDITTINNAIADLTSLPGDVYGLERDRNGKHGRIMRYGLNRP